MDIKDLPRPQQLFQMLAHGGRQDVHRLSEELICQDLDGWQDWPTGRLHGSTEPGRPSEDLDERGRANPRLL